jgi:quercetin dioxygenase-like cupin family protein
MTEQVIQYTTGDDNTIERVVQDGTIHINHMVLRKGDGFPGHIANATVYMTVTRGRLCIDLDDQQTHEYGRGSILKIARGTKMRGYNRCEETLEIFVVKVLPDERERTAEEKQA